MLEELLLPLDTIVVDFIMILGWNSRFSLLEWLSVHAVVGGTGDLHCVCDRLKSCDDGTSTSTS